MRVTSSRACSTKRTRLSSVSSRETIRCYPKSAICDGYNCLFSISRQDYACRKVASPWEYEIFECVELSKFARYYIAVHVRESALTEWEEICKSVTHFLQSGKFICWAEFWAKLFQNLLFDWSKCDFILFEIGFTHMWVSWANSAREIISRSSRREQIFRWQNRWPNWRDPLRLARTGREIGTGLSMKLRQQSQTVGTRWFPWTVRNTSVCKEFAFELWRFLNIKGTLCLWISSLGMPRDPSANGVDRVVHRLRRRWFCSM